MHLWHRGFLFSLVFRLFKDWWTAIPATLQTRALPLGLESVTCLCWTAYTVPERLVPSGLSNTWRGTIYGLVLSPRNAIIVHQFLLLYRCNYFCDALLATQVVTLDLRIWKCWCNSVFVADCMCARLCVCSWRSRFVVNVLASRWTKCHCFNDSLLFYKSNA